MSDIRVENGLVVGTSGDKYKSGNPIARHLVNRFDQSIAELVGSVSPGSVLEIGCGEGHVTRVLLDNTKATVHATDISESVLCETRENLTSPRVTWETVSLENIRAHSTPDMVVCCEVLEHIPNPDEGLKVLAQIQARSYLLSVPREPIWRILNFCRGAYIRDLGNSPGHIQHWSKKGFTRLVSQYFDVVQVRSPLPWTMLLCKTPGCHQ